MTEINQFDKARFFGAGDRVEREKWLRVIEPDQQRVQPVTFEGWPDGFHSLSNNIN
jgi:pantothenate kinase-related protein Tda10